MLFNIRYGRVEENSHITYYTYICIKALTGLLYSFIIWEIYKLWKHIGVPVRNSFHINLLHILEQ